MDHYPPVTPAEIQAEQTQFQILNYLSQVMLKNPRAVGEITVRDTPVSVYDNRLENNSQLPGSQQSLSSRLIISHNKTSPWAILYANQPDEILSKHIVIVALPDDKISKTHKQRYFIDPVSGQVDYDSLPIHSKLRKLSAGIKLAGHIMRNVAICHGGQWSESEQNPPHPVRPLASQQTSDRLLSFLKQIAQSDGK